MKRGIRSLEHYARWIERRWSTFVERPVVLSNGDWETIRTWYEQRVPLALIGECIDEAGARRRRGRTRQPPRSLRYLEPSVREAWSVLRADEAAQRSRRAREAKPRDRTC